MMVIGAPLWKAHTMMRRMKFGEQCLPVRGCFETCSLRGSGFQTDRTAALCCRLRLTRRAALARSLRVVASRFSRCIVIVGFLCAAGEPCAGYSLLTHEEIVDILWKDQIQPLLLKRYPAASANQLRKAHAYAYGGSLIQDIGYYPFGNKFFSDLTHYVCTGDFVANLICESADIDQYAFALGALAHYSSDNTGHPAINHAVALTFPKLRRKYGERVTYEQNPKAHIQTEFGFDITQVAKHRYTSDSYHDFIGFEVSKPALERAFLKTYGLRLEDVLGHMDLSIGTFRHAVSGVIPEMTRAALTAYHPEIVRDATNFSEGRFLYNLSRTQYETEWGKEYRRPGFFTRVLGLFVRLGAEDRVSGCPRFQTAFATDRRYVHQEHQPDPGRLSEVAAACRRGRPAFPKPGLRHWPACRSRRICPKRPDLCAVAGGTDQKQPEKCLPGIARRYPGLLFRSIPAGSAAAPGKRTHRPGTRGPPRRTAIRRGASGAKEPPRAPFQAPEPQSEGGLRKYANGAI